MELCFSVLLPNIFIFFNSCYKFYDNRKLHNGNNVPKGNYDLQYD